jgi:starch phosphorylase
MPSSLSQAFSYDKLGSDRDSLRRSLANLLIYSLGKDPITATSRDWFNSTAYAVRERLI